MLINRFQKDGKAYVVFCHMNRFLMISFGQEMKKEKVQFSNKMVSEQEIIDCYNTIAGKELITVIESTISSTSDEELILLKSDGIFHYLISNGAGRIIEYNNSWKKNDVEFIVNEYALQYLEFSNHNNDDFEFIDEGIADLMHA